MAAINISYRASTIITVAPQNVATSATFVAGVESALYDNTGNKDLDVIVSGIWTAGTTPVANTQVLIYVVAALDDVPTWPDVFDGVSSAETITSAGVGQSFMRLAAVLSVDSATSNRVYNCTFSIAALFGGVLPPKWVLFITHNTGVNSNATAGNHVWKATGISFTVL